ncbi:MAG: tyrosine-type recombinase/integrase [Bifidobacteriaceae bacterium]|nr:tyrosine-type recombinase/integrase [Bifidobacteriaceae bacterium]
MNGLRSGLATHIEGLIELKRALGFPYQTGERHLCAFDAMCADNNPGEAALTRQMAMGWARARPGEHVNSQTRRITPIRQLAKHMARVGAEAYVIPAGVPGRRVRYTPHIFSRAELRALFDAADQVRESSHSGPRHLVIPVVFRMLYCLGLRPGEARRLLVADVDLARGSVFIRESKGHSDRIVFMSQDLLDFCRSYDQQITALQPVRAAFFPNRFGRPYNPSTIGCWFHQLVEAAGPGAVNARPGSPPRPYDLRHAHVAEVINRQVKAGRDPLALVPHLSAQLGHANLADTLYYFHLVPGFYTDLRDLANSPVEARIPEADNGVR